MKRDLGVYVLTVVLTQAALFQGMKLQTGSMQHRSFHGCLKFLGTTFSSKESFKRTLHLANDLLQAEQVDSRYALHARTLCLIGHAVVRVFVLHNTSSKTKSVSATLEQQVQIDTSQY